ncbi:MAG: glycosyltransferase family 39 protein [Candidatus Pacebacteria bacterium]|nr:glycosyltransferase family 39 protein [Candidatus Paceibacterota bacterium]
MNTPSFTAPRVIAYVILALIMLASALIMISVAHQESAIMDELAHIPAGYGYVSQFDYRLNPEHPPLVKALSALPLLFIHPTFPINASAWQQDVNGQWVMGSLFMYWSGNNADTIIFLSRLFPIILMLILIAVVFFWARTLVGPWWALIPTFLTGLSPHFLAHGHYVTTDIGATLGIVCALFAFTRFLNHQTKKTLIVAGLLFGVAQLMKFSSVLLIPLMLVIAFLYWCAWCKEKKLRFFSLRNMEQGFGLLVRLIGIFIVGFLLVWVVYGLFTLQYPPEKQTADTAFLLGSFSGGSRGSLAQSCLPPTMRCAAELDIWMADIPVLRSFGHYLLGVLMVMQRASGGNTAYFLGNVGAGGWWYYFPVVYFFKESLPALCMIALGLVAALWRMIKPAGHLPRQKWYSYILLNTSECVMIGFVLLYWAYSIKSPLNIGVRHILPTIPFMYILATVSIKKILAKRAQRAEGKISTTVVFGVVFALLLLWVAAETTRAYPYYLSYFNQMGGGVSEGWRKVTDSNYDWGQDLKRLQLFTQEHTIPAIAVDYFGGGDVSYYLGEKAYYWNSAKGNPLHYGITWFAISINSLSGAKAPTVPGFERKDIDSYPWLSDWEHPFARIGTSIFVYKLTNN